MNQKCAYNAKTRLQEWVMNWCWLWQCYNPTIFNIICWVAYKTMSRCCFKTFEKKLLKTSKIVLMYSNSLARHFSPMFHAKCLLPKLDKLLHVKSWLKYLYQCGFKIWRFFLMFSTVSMLTYWVDRSKNYKKLPMWMFPTLKKIDWCSFFREWHTCEWPGNMFCFLWFLSSVRFNYKPGYKLG